MRIVFMGTPHFAVPSLETLARNGYAPVAVVTSPDAPGRRGAPDVPPPVKIAAQKLGIETILQPDSVRDPAFADALGALQPDLFVVVAFKILPSAVFGIPRLGAFNLHGSLLPRYRGAAPIQRAVMAGEVETGVTTFFLQEQVDTGNVLLQRREPVGPDETAGDVHDRLMHVGAELVLETVRLIARGEAVPKPQDDAQATPAPKLFREEGELDWKWPAARVHNHARGFSPVPGAWTFFRGEPLKILRTRQAEGTGTPGTVIRLDPLTVACGERAVELVEMQPPGRRRMDAAAFVNGSRVEVGEQMG